MQRCEARVVLVQEHKLATWPKVTGGNRVHETVGLGIFLVAMRDHGQGGLVSRRGHPRSLLLGRVAGPQQEPRFVSISIDSRIVSVKVVW
eukprot:626418-Pyramimonas_sp.AAC.1